MINKPLNKSGFLVMGLNILKYFKLMVYYQFISAPSELILLLNLDID